MTLLIVNPSYLFVYYFSKDKEQAGGRIRLIISGGAPLSSEIEEFLRVTCCCFVVQGYGKQINVHCYFMSSLLKSDLVYTASIYIQLIIELIHMHYSRLFHYRVDRNYWPNYSWVS